MKSRKLILSALLSVVAAGVSLPAASQGANRLITGFPPGGSVDLVARPLAERLAAGNNSNWIVDSRPGAAGMIAINYVKNQPADGTTILLSPSPMITMYPHTYKKLDYDPLTDLTPVTSTVQLPYVLAAGPGVPANVQDMASLIEWLKANPEKAAFGSPGAGSSPHMAGVLLSQNLGVNLLHVPYKGGAPMIVDLVGGQIPVGITVLSDVLPHVKSGSLRPLAITGSNRSDNFPNTPTFNEAGIAGLDFVDWFGVFLPKGASQEVAESLNRDVVKALNDPKLKQILLDNGFQIGGESQAEFAATVKSDLERWGPVVKASGFSVDN